MKNMKVNLNSLLNMEKEYKLFQMEMFLKVIFKEILQMGMVNIIGKTEMFIKECL
jgi:hypothetical protein